jgi:Xaa-Pro aminopeptidase
MMNPSEQKRITCLREEMAKANLDAMLITDIVNISWLSGFTGSSAVLIVTQDNNLFCTDSRYVTQAAQECPGFNLYKRERGGMEEIIQQLNTMPVKTIGFEENQLIWKSWKTITDALAENLSLVPAYRILEKLRHIKDNTEIALIQAACDIADRAFDHIITFIQPGITERDVMLELEWFMRKEEHAEVAFDTILASGPRSALPHGHATERVLQMGDFITMDYGARWKGYCSDITRTVILGNPNEEQKKVYGIVKDANQKAMDAMVAGRCAKEPDDIARGIIRDAGYGAYFGHGLGHSLGRDVHDGPGLSPYSAFNLEAGMVITVEPGIYIPEWGGVRIEQDVLVTEGEPQILTHSTTELVIL